MNLSVPEGAVDISGFKDAKVMADSKANERIGAALAFFVDSIVQSGQTIEKIDKTVLDYHIAEIDKRLSMQLDEILHHTNFQKI